MSGSPTRLTSQYPALSVTTFRLKSTFGVAASEVPHGDEIILNGIGNLISKTRLSRGWSFGDLARACGAVTPKQTSRVSQRLVRFEREGVRDRKLLLKVIAALDLDPVVFGELLHRQRAEELAEWNDWISKPVPIELHVRPFGGFWYRQPLPIQIASDELRAIAYAKQITAGRRELWVVLALNRRRSMSFVAGEIVSIIDAKPNAGMTPFVEIDGGQIVFEAH